MVVSSAVFAGRLCVDFRLYLAPCRVLLPRTHWVRGGGCDSLLLLKVHAAVKLQQMDDSSVCVCLIICAMLAHCAAYEVQFACCIVSLSRLPVFHWLSGQMEKRMILHCDTVLMVVAGENAFGIRAGRFFQAPPSLVQPYRCTQHSPPSFVTAELSCICAG